jgi:hypothetical protein
VVTQVPYFRRNCQTAIHEVRLDKAPTSSSEAL